MDEKDFRPKAKSAFEARDLDTLSIRELEDYITCLESEIGRVRSDIMRKQAHKDAMNALFKS